MYMPNFDKNTTKKVFWFPEHFHMLSFIRTKRSSSILVNCHLVPLTTDGTDSAGTRAPASQDRERAHALAPRHECTSDSEVHHCTHARTRADTRLCF